MFLQQLSHPNIITLEKIIKAHNHKDIYLVFEHMDVDLHTLVREGNILQHKHKKYIIYQIAKALYYLHNSDIIHRDLKPSNVLVNE
jgi:mitogen-activated protein kinase 15